MPCPSIPPHPLTVVRFGFSHLFPAHILKPIGVFFDSPPHEEQHEPRDMRGTNKRRCEDPNRSPDNDGQPVQVLVHV